jgi:hypothetical protein
MIELPAYQLDLISEVLTNACIGSGMLASPAFKLRPRLSLDGNKWSAVYGENLQDGVAGFGDSPAEAFADFDRSWTQKINSPK